MSKGERNRARARVRAHYPEAHLQHNYLEGGLYVLSGRGRGHEARILGESFGNGSLKADRTAAWEAALNRILAEALAR